jgi:glucose/arabinose dehydrogenase
MVLVLIALITTSSGIIPKDCEVETCSQPTIKDANLKVELVATGLNAPSNLAFLGQDILYLERYTGKVRAIINDTAVSQPLLDVSVAGRGERGMLGIALSNNNGHDYVFLYYTESTSDIGC